MYRQGLGDCFLVTLPRSGDQGNYHILIDCGVILGTPNAETTLRKVLKDVSALSKGRIDLLVATHQHWDHLSGFMQAAETFDTLDIKKVWMAWTENPDDELAKELAGERDAAMKALRFAGSRMLILGDLERAVSLLGLQVSSALSVASPLRMRSKRPARRHRFATVIRLTSPFN
jgi:glyoxylase-like metal-dependent hydrolase (beta-lactamase superfamily II)